MTQKSMALKAIRNMPETATLQDIQERIAYLEGIQKGLKQIDRGQTVSLKSVQKKIAKWATK